VLNDQTRLDCATFSRIIAGICAALVLMWEVVDGPVRAHEGGHFGVLFVLFALAILGLGLIGLLCWTASRTRWSRAATVNVVVMAWVVARFLLGR
jgi:hypothetical protein